MYDSYIPKAQPYKEIPTTCGLSLRRNPYESDLSWLTSLRSRLGKEERLHVFVMV
jgi:hypothetical protein